MRSKEKGALGQHKTKVLGRFFPSSLSHCKFVSERKLRGVPFVPVYRETTSPIMVPDLDKYFSSPFPLQFIVFFLLCVPHVARVPPYSTYFEGEKAPSDSKRRFGDRDSPVNSFDDEDAAKKSSVFPLSFISFPHRQTAANNQFEAPMVHAPSKRTRTAPLVPLVRYCFFSLPLISSPSFPTPLRTRNGSKSQLTKLCAFALAHHVSFTSSFLFHLLIHSSHALLCLVAEREKP